MRHLALFLAAAVLVAGPLPKAKRKPAPSTSEQQRLIKEGVELADSAEYEQALAKFRRVLEETPDNTSAIYESVFVYGKQKNYKECVNTGLKGAEYDSPGLNQFYQAIGNCLDDMGDSKRAIEFYSAALDRFSDDYLLAYNLGFACYRAGRATEARTALKRAIVANPNHPSSHRLLGQLYLESKENIPALLALSRFLILEPSSKRSPVVIALLRDVLGQGVHRESEHKVNITLFVPDKKTIQQEGDFSPAQLALQMAAVVPDTEEFKKEHAGELNAGLKEAFLVTFSTLLASDTKSGFARTYYAPYFAELDKRGFIEPFLYFAWRSAELPGGADYLAANQQKISDFLQWSRTYTWPKVK